MLDDFVTMCRQAAASPDPIGSVRALLVELVSDSTRLGDAIPAPQPHACGRCGADDTVFEDADVTIIVVHSRPGITQPPHDHSMPALIGVYEGCEAQRFFRRDDTAGADGTLVETPGRTIGAGEVLTLGSSTIHAISTADDSWARAVHVYLGPLSSVDRSLYDPATSRPEPMTTERYDALARSKS